MVGGEVVIRGGVVIILTLSDVGGNAVVHHRMTIRMEVVEYYGGFGGEKGSGKKF